MGVSVRIHLRVGACTCAKADTCSFMCACICASTYACSVRVFVPVRVGMRVCVRVCVNVRCRALEMQRLYSQMHYFTTGLVS